MKNLILIVIAIILTTQFGQGQHTDANVFGDVQCKGEHLPFVTVYVEGTTLGTTTDITGHFMLIDLPEGNHILIAQSIGYSLSKKEITVEKGVLLEVNFELEEESMTLNEFVVTGTRTFKRQTESPVIVNVLEAKTLDAVQACNISEGLRFQPGLRVETDCQTCNYTQLRMNGLGGSYSQILINGRPIFSPLTGLYGMEQIPTNMVDRIEVVRGGGSALYGSSAIGGTVNIITRIPKENTYDVSGTMQSINGQAMDNILSGNISMLTKKRNAGAALFVNRRNRAWYDHNGDNFSEIPTLRNNSFGGTLFFKPDYNQKLELSFSSLSEYRSGGEMVDDPAYLAQQSEERTHNVFMGGLDYQINLNEDNSSIIAYFAGQHTGRDHFTGIFPDDSLDMIDYVFNPPYGKTSNTTLQGGMQANHRFEEFALGPNIMTVGAEYLYDDVKDSIPAYNFLVDQQTHNLGLFFQSDWNMFQDMTLLIGLRADKHNLVDRMIFSPRVSLLYKYKRNTQFRLTWGTGFRAPQAFDSDLHIAFAGGGVSRIILDPNLSEERSNSLSGSVNYDKASESFIFGFTMEGFYTKLDDAFYLQPIGQDEFGEVFEKRNGPGASVYGGTIELRANYNRQVQLEAGFTIQRSLFDEPVQHIDDLEPTQTFLRSPDQYGYFTFTYNPDDRFSGSISSVYTGPMLLAHFAGAPEQAEDEYKTSPAFTELNLKLGYTIPIENVGTGLEIFGGIRNITNAYQEDFDTGKYRDSGYVYGPGQPRTYFVGLRLKSI